MKVNILVSLGRYQELEVPESVESYSDCKRMILLTFMEKVLKTEEKCDAWARRTGLSMRDILVIGRNDGIRVTEANFAQQRLSNQEFIMYFERANQ